MDKIHEQLLLYALLGMAVEVNNDTMTDVIIDALDGYELMDQYNKYVGEGIKFRMELL